MRGNSHPALSEERVSALIEACFPEEESSSGIYPHSLLRWLALDRKWEKCGHTADEVCGRVLAQEDSPLTALLLAGLPGTPTDDLLLHTLATSDRPLGLYGVTQVRDELSRFDQKIQQSTFDALMERVAPDEREQCRALAVELIEVNDELAQPATASAAPSFA